MWTFCTMWLWNFLFVWKKPKQYRQLQLFACISFNIPKPDGFDSFNILCVSIWLIYLNISFYLYLTIKTLLYVYMYMRTIQYTNFCMYTTNTGIYVYVCIYIYIFIVVIPHCLGWHFALWVTVLEEETKIDRRSTEGFSAVKLNYRQWLKWILICLSLKGECALLSNIWYDNACRHFLRWNNLCLLFHLFREE